MSLQFDAPDAGPELPSSIGPTQDQSMTSLFAHLDGVIDHATRTRQLALSAKDGTAGDALDDAISLLQHVRSRLKYDLGPTL